MVVKASLEMQTCVGILAVGGQVNLQVEASLMQDAKLLQFPEVQLVYTLMQDAKLIQFPEVQLVYTVENNAVASVGWLNVEKLDLIQVIAIEHK